MSKMSIFFLFQYGCFNCQNWGVTGYAQKVERLGQKEGNWFYVHVSLCSAQLFLGFCIKQSWMNNVN